MAYGIAAFPMTFSDQGGLAHGRCFKMGFFVHLSSSWQTSTHIDRRELWLFTPTISVSQQVDRALPDKHSFVYWFACNMAAEDQCVAAGAIFCQLFCWSLEHGTVPLHVKAAYITPTVNSTDTDRSDVKSYRLISYLSVL